MTEPFHDLEFGDWYEGGEIRPGDKTGPRFCGGFWGMVFLWGIISVVALVAVLWS